MSGIFKIWKIARKFTAQMAQQAFEKIIKQPLSLIFRRRFKSRHSGDRKQERWWIEVKGNQEELMMLGNRQKEIEQQLGCHLEAKAQG